MADATTLSIASPKQLGKQLRSVRRRKGLSLSEVARGAGLSRRELVAYERGKVEIPESDLWVIAGSCGVDVAELVPPTDPLALPSGPESIEDTISQLRRAQPGDSVQRHLDTLYALRSLPPGSVVQLEEGERAAMAEALGGSPSAIERRLVETMRVSNDEAKRLRALVLPDAPRYSPLALDAPTPAPQPAPPVAAPAYDATAFDAKPYDARPYDATGVFAPNGVVAPDLAPVREPDLAAGPVDVFEELAKLPEPVALPDQHAAGHDMFAPPPEPVTVPAAAEAGAAGPFATWSSMRSALPEPSAPVVVEPMPPTPGEPTFGATHAPPIDVVGRVDVPTVPNGFWNPLPMNGDGGLTPADAVADAPPVGDPHDLVEAVDSIGTDAAPAEALEDTTAETRDDAPARRTGGWSAWWTPPSTPEHANGVNGVEAANGVDAVDAVGPPPAFEGITPGMPEAPAPVGHATTPVHMIEFVDHYGVDEPPTAMQEPEPFPDVPMAGEAPVAEGAEGLVRPAFECFTPASYEAPVEAPMTDAERYAAGVFEPAPTDDESTGLPTTGLPTTDAARSAPGTLPSWQLPGMVEAPIGIEPRDSEGWSPNGAAASDDHTAVVQDAGADTPWGRQPDPEASSTGFLVDWGSADATSGAVTDTADDPWVAAALNTQVGTAATFEPAVEELQDVTPAPFAPAVEPEPEPEPDPTFVYEAAGPSLSDALTTTIDAPVTDVAPEPEEAPVWATTIDEPVADTAPEPEEVPTWATSDEPAPISWRPLADTVLAAVAVEMATREDEPVDAPEPEPEVAPDPVEEFVTAGEEWELGNALPLVEVRGQGGLVMRRADERWALADVRSTTSFALEVDVDFRSGPGFGVLFRASTDDDGHMSGYSFDVDPIHEGGSYLVRQWQADRELWNPIAHVPAPDPSDMHGVLTLRVVVTGDSVTASVNDAVVLSVDSLERACAERNREPATGDRVGIQAWSSSDLVIDTLRVAER